VTADHGSVTIEPDKPSYDDGETVTLIPRPDVGYSFSHWSGDLRSRRLVGRVTMDSDKSIAASFDTWQLPIGIPAPEFGIFETYRMYDDIANRNPALIYRRNSEGGYYTHYIDNTHPNSTDLGNPYGDESIPRRSIPKPIPAGSIVEVHGGPYTGSVGSVFVKGYGTLDRPIFVRGLAGDIPYFSTKIRAEGTYMILEGLAAIGCNVMGEYNGTRDTNHIGVRNCNIYSTSKRSGGVAVGEYTASSPVRVDDIVVYNNNIHDFGDIDSEVDEDAGGVFLASKAAHVWIVDNQIHELSGSGVQVLPGNSISGQTAEYIYVGRNHVYRARQSGIWAKYGRDIVFSQNTIHDIIHTAWSPSKGMGLQYGPQNVWYIFNDVYASAMGFYGPSTNGGSNVSAYVIGNTIHDLVLPADYMYNPNNSYAFSAITWYGSAHRYIIGNTIYSTSGGVYCGSTGGGDFTIANNIIADMTLGGQHILFEYGAMADTSILQNNLFHQSGGSVVVEWGSVITGDMDTLISLTSTGEGCIVDDPKFIDVLRLIWAPLLAWLKRCLTSLLDGMASIFGGTLRGGPGRRGRRGILGRMSIRWRRLGIWRVRGRVRTR